MPRVKKPDRIIKIKAYELVDVIKKAKYLRDGGLDAVLGRSGIIETLDRIGMTLDEKSQCL